MSDTTGHNTVTVTRVEVIDAIETAFKKAPLTKEDLVAAAEHAGVRRRSSNCSSGCLGASTGARPTCGTSSPSVPDRALTPNRRDGFEPVGRRDPVPRGASSS